MTEALVLPEGADLDEVIAQILRHDHSAVTVLRHITHATRLGFSTLCGQARIAHATGLSMRTVGSALSRLRYVYGLIERVNRAAEMACTVVIDVFQKMVNAFVRLPQQPDGNRTATGQQPDSNRTAVSPAVASAVENSCDHSCPHCGHVFSPQNQLVTAVAAAPPGPVLVAAAPAAYKEDARAGSNSKRSRSEKTRSSTGLGFAQKPEPPVHARPASMEELFAPEQPDYPTEEDLAEDAAQQPGERKFRYLLPRDTPIEWHHSDEALEDAANMVRYIADKWFPDPAECAAYKAALKVERTGLIGILQAGPRDALWAVVEGFIKYIRKEDCRGARRPDAQNLMVYIRTVVWDKLRGLKWSKYDPYKTARPARHLPHYFTRDRERLAVLRKPPEVQDVPMLDMKQLVNQMRQMPNPKVY